MKSSINHFFTKWTTPYTDPDIKSVFTGLNGRFKYSPIFTNCLADTMVELTGHRSKDYVIAEAQTGKKHTPGVTVWHHVWEKQDGKYRMQLVSFEEHKKTCPHAGGCKLWLLNSTENRVSYRQMEHFEESGDYSDLSLFYPIRNSKIKFYQNGYVSKKTLLFAKKERAELFGIDVYGNLLYKNNTNLYFWDHEFDLVFSVKNNGQFYQLLLK